MCASEQPDNNDMQSMYSACTGLQKQQTLASEINDIVEELQLPKQNKKSAFAAKAL